MLWIKKFDRTTQESLFASQKTTPVIELETGLGTEVFIGSQKTPLFLKKTLTEVQTKNLTVEALMGPLKLKELKAIPSFFCAVLFQTMHC